MDEDRLISALQRLALALTRLEDAQARLAAHPSADADNAEEVEQLRARIDQLAAHNAALDVQHLALAERHQRLRASAADAAARLDALVG